MELNQVITTLHSHKSLILMKEFKKLWLISNDSSHISHWQFIKYQLAQINLFLFRIYYWSEITPREWVQKKQETLGHLSN